MHRSLLQQVRTGYLTLKHRGRYLHTELMAVWTFTCVRAPHHLLAQIKVSGTHVSFPGIMHLCVEHTQPAIRLFFTWLNAHRNFPT